MVLYVKRHELQQGSWTSVSTLSSRPTSLHEGLILKLVLLRTDLTTGKLEKAHLICYDIPLGEESSGFQSLLSSSYLFLTNDHLM